MSYAIDPRKVAGVVIDANAALARGDKNHGEVILGLSELIGRVIVEAASTSLQADEMRNIVHEHLAKTVAIGLRARQRSIITEP